MRRVRDRQGDARPIRRGCILLAVVLAMALPATAARAQTQSFTASYTGQGAFSSSCGSNMDIVGEEPTTGTHPVFLWMVGTFELDIDDTPAHTIVAGMAARGFVAASVQYDNSFFGTCGQIEGKAECIFDANSAESAVSVLCSRPHADCRGGIVVGGLSQGSIVADLAANWGAPVRAAWGIGDGTNYAFFDVSACVEPTNRALPMDRLRIVNGEHDTYVSGSDHSRTQSSAVTGYNCGPTAWDCLQADGSGYYIVQDSQVEDGEADHCYHGDGGCIASQNSLDPGWESGNEPWHMNPNLDWLASFAGFCGDGEVQSTPPFAEECDLGAANGAAGSCCTASCTLSFASTVCRPAAGDCDLAESCSGTTTTCPADARKTAGAACSDDGNACTLDECDGTTLACQHPVGNAGATCRASAGPCDVVETCTGTTVDCPPDALQPATVCRPAAGTCDVAESCTGASAVCPPDALRPSGFECRAAAGVCDVAETCSGTSAACPADAFQSSATPCRPSAGICDLAESCTGTTAACPADAFQSSATPCRPSAGICDVAESCTGTSAACPANGFASGVTPCRPSAGICDVAESCTGSSAACPVDTFQSSASVCRGSAGVCDVAEHCSGTTAACPADGFASSASVCRLSAGMCDVAESCTGASATCPVDAYAAATSVCRPAAGDCDAAESCTGTSPACPIDASQPDGAPCDDGMVCTVADTCVGGLCGGASVICGDGVVQASCGEECDDGNTTSDDGCSAMCHSEFVCAPGPRAGCKRPIALGAALLQLKDKPSDPKDTLGWKWAKGAATAFAELGAPLTTTAYLLCIYDERGVVASAFVPAGQQCAGTACWAANSRGYKYKDKAATPDGLTMMTLTAGADGSAKISIKGKGLNLPMPTLPMVSPVTVQLRNSIGGCWEAVYDAPATKNDAAQYKDKSS